MKYIYRPSAARRLQQIPAGPGARLPANDGDIIDTDDAAWVARINETVAGDNGMLALIALADQSEPAPKPKAAAPAAAAPAPAEVPGLDDLTAAQTVRLAMSLDFRGERRKGDARAHLDSLDPAEVSAALADMQADD